MKLTLPPFEYKVKKQGGSIYIFDDIRKKYVLLTPEEWVRQHFIHYLVIYKKYPKILISLEKEVVINGLKRRFDILCYDRQGLPYLVVECKAPQVAVSQKVFDQVFEYNTVLQARYVIVTNGILHLCGKMGEGECTVSGELPEFGTDSL